MKDSITRTERLLIAFSLQLAAERLLREAARAITAREPAGFLPGLAQTAFAVARWHGVYETLPETNALAYAYKKGFPAEDARPLERELIVAVVNHIDGVEPTKAPSKVPHLCLVKEGGAR